MKRCTTVLFDLDGTLIDTSDGVIGSALYTLEKLGYPTGRPEDYLPFLGPPLSFGFGVVFGVKPSDVPRAIEVFRARYIGEEWFLRSTVYPGIPELLAALRGDGYRIAVTTSKLQLAAEKTLSRFGLFDLFDLVAHPVCQLLILITVGVVSIRAFDPDIGFRILIHVKSSGAGPKEDEMLHIFDSFYRGSNIGEKKGSGLGLYISRELMKRMDGDIYATADDGSFTAVVITKKA